MPEPFRPFASLVDRLRRVLQPRPASFNQRLTFSVVLIVVLTALFGALPAVMVIYNQLQRRIETRVEEAQVATQQIYTAERQRLLDLTHFIAERPTLCHLVLADDRESLIPYLEKVRQGTQIDAIFLVPTDREPILSGSLQLPAPQVLQADRSLPFSDFIAQGEPPGLYIAAAVAIDSTGECASGSPGWVLSIQSMDDNTMRVLAQQTGLQQSLIVAGRRAATSLPVAPDWPLDPGAAKTVQQTLTSCCIQGAYEKETYQIGLAPLLDQQGRLVALSELALPIHSLRSAALSSLGLLAGASFLIALVGALITLALTNRITRPLDDLVEAVKKFSQGDLGTPIPTQSDWVEINQLADQLEISRQHLQRSFQENQREMKRVMRLLSASRTDLDTDRQRSEFLASLAHEFRTPISSITATIELLSEDGANMSQEEITELTDTALLATHHMQTLIDNVLESAIIEADCFHLRCHPILLRDVLRNAVNIMSPLLKRRQQSLEIDQPRHFLTILADPDRLCQAIVNLLDNASKFSPFDSTIYLSFKRQGNMLVFNILDSGPGIPADQLNDIFRRYASFTDRQGARHGIGLGLPVVKTIIETHGGQVGAENRIEGGARFWFTMPLTPPLAPRLES